jgi:hypothetical protein
VFDCLDALRTRVVYSSDDPKRIMNATQFHFLADRMRDVPVFVCSSYPAPTFATTSFVSLVPQERLRGFRFADPGANPFRAILRGISANVVPEHYHERARPVLAAPPNEEMPPTKPDDSSCRRGAVIMFAAAAPSSLSRALQLISGVRRTLGAAARGA